MKRTPVTSSNIASIGYNEQQSLLEIEFNNGGVYQYYDVPISVYQEQLNASSHGKYFAEKIRNNYQYEKYEHD